MIDVNRIRRAPWQLVEFATDAIRTATGLRRFRNAEAVAIITPGKILQLQSAGTRDVLQSLTSGGQTRAAGPYVISHSRATAGSRGWGQAYGEAWVRADSAPQPCERCHCLWHLHLRWHGRGRHPDKPERCHGRLPDRRLDVRRNQPGKQPGALHDPSPSDGKAGVVPRRSVRWRALPWQANQRAKSAATRTPSRCAAEAAMGARTRTSCRTDRFC